MSQWDVAELIKRLLMKYPHAEVHKEICLATQVRQEAVAGQAGECDLVLVVGDPRSNNSNRLAQVSEEIAGTRAYRISDVSEINLDWLKGVKKVGITSGASTPTPITKEVIDFLQKYDENNKETWEKERKVTLNRILPKVKEKK
jgi:4-hydroxy-3-methylbut-2-enyl diphosphate reductase